MSSPIGQVEQDNIRLGSFPVEDDVATVLGYVEIADDKFGTERYKSVRLPSKLGKVTRELWKVTRSGSPPVGRMRQTSLSSSGKPWTK